jgi:hypothetical protein
VRSPVKCTTAPSVSREVEESEGAVAREVEDSECAFAREVEESEGAIAREVDDRTFGVLHFTGRDATRQSFWWQSISETYTRRQARRPQNCQQDIC